jgi:hypothetical protein
MCARLETERAEGLDSYPLSKSLSSISWCLANIKIVAKKIWTLQIPLPETGDFLEKG